MPTYIFLEKKKGSFAAAQFTAEVNILVEEPDRPGLNKSQHPRRVCNYWISDYRKQRLDA
jgi:hypothetical protein